MIAKVVLATFAYCLVTTMLFGNPLQPIFLATLWSDRLGVSYWRAVAILCIATSAFAVARPLRGMIPEVFRPAVFVILAVLAPTVTVGLYADKIRHSAVLALGADEFEERSFFASIREAPADFQFFLHTAALKDCTAYAWSYRQQGFYVLNSDTGANVLPRQWIDRCGIARTNGG